MARELFSIAAQEHKESTRESKRRKIVILVAWVFAIAYVGHSLFLLQDFPPHIPFQQAITVHENQATLMRAVIEFGIGLLALAISMFMLRPSLWSFAIFFILAVIEGGIVVYSHWSGFEIVRGRGLGAAYMLCFALPILTIILVIEQRQKHRE